MPEAAAVENVILFARVDERLNPYIVLYKRAIESRGVSAVWERELGLRWLLSRGRQGGIVHLHWIESTYQPAPKMVRSRVWRRLRLSRIVQVWLGGFRLADFVMTLLLLRLTGAWVVYTAHNLEAHDRMPWPFPWFRWCAQQATFRLAHRLHVNSRSARKTVSIACRRPDKVSLVPLGNYLGWYPNQVSREDARRQLGLPKGAPTYLLFGLLRPYKGIDELIRAFAKLPSPQARLLLVGKPFASGYATHLRELCRHSTRIMLVAEFIPDERVQVYMKACDACILPYKGAASSAAVMLALSFGRPVIAPRIGCFPDAITPETGILYDPADSDGLASAMSEAADRPFSETAILRHARRFDWETLAGQLVELYRRAG